MAAAPLPTAMADGAPLSQGVRIVNTFIAPAKTFTDLRRNASWWAPFLLSVIVSIIFVAVVDQKVGFRKVTENQIQMSPKASARLDQMPAAEGNKAIVSQATVTRYISYGFWLLILIYAICGMDDFFVTTHVAAFAQDHGLSALFAGNLLAGIGTLSLAGEGQVIAWEAHVGGFLAGLLLFPLFDPIRSGDRPGPVEAQTDPPRD